MAYQYTTIDGQRVEVNVAAAFRHLAAAFYARFGLTLHVRGGVRTRAEQLHFYNLYRQGKGNLALHPDHPQAYHVETNPRGPRALDVFDSGRDAGVTVAGTIRSRWLRENAARFGFDPAGFQFSQVEPWHIEYTGQLARNAGVVTVVKEAVAKVTARRTLQGLPWRGVQRMLKSDFGYRGAIDNTPGAGTISAHQRFLNAKGYARRALGKNLVVDGADGGDTLAATQQWLKERWAYTGRIDRIRGAGTNAAWARAEAANGRAYAGVR